MRGNSIKTMGRLGSSKQGNSIKGRLGSSKQGFGISGPPLFIYDDYFSSVVRFIAPAPGRLSVSVFQGTRARTPRAQDPGTWGALPHKLGVGKARSTHAMHGF